MTYGYRIENWRAFEAELAKRGIALEDIEKVELRPEVPPAGSLVRITLRSGRTEAWHHPEHDAAGTDRA